MKLGRGNRDGRGRGQGAGTGGGAGSGGGNLPGSGPDGTCRCPSCDHTEPHQRGVPCYTRTCPKCGTQLVKS
ncbi:MAG TPA: hypothetical protein ENN14_00235 [Chloroflexi bacterium]|nr:hypothetical protein [Chloroflexota bacterium]